VRNRSGILAGLCALWLGVACAAAPGDVVWATGAGSRTSDGLQRVRWSDLGALFLKPGAQMQGYHQVLLEPLKIAPASPDEERRAFVPTPNYPPTPDYLAGMQGLYRDAFAEELGRNGFELVSAPGPGVLKLSGYVLDLILTARLDPQDQARTTEIVRSFGELTLVLDLRDATSDTPLLRAIDRQQISSDPLMGAVRNSIGANLSAQRQIFDHEAMLLRTRLQELQQVPALPPSP
jgi:hypothetical protein